MKLIKEFFVNRWGTFKIVIEACIYLWLIYTILYWGMENFDGHDVSLIEIVESQLQCISHWRIF